MFGAVGALSFALGSSGCAIPVHRVNHELYERGEAVRPEAREVGPVATGAATDGEDLLIAAEWRRECRDSTYKVIQMETRSETKPKGRLTTMWVATAFWTGAAITAVALADPQTELGSGPFVLAAIAVPVAGVQWGTSIRTMMQFEEPKRYTRDEFVSAEEWARCGGRPVTGELRAFVATSEGASLTLDSKESADGEFAFGGKAVSAAAWSDPAWTVQLAQPKTESAGKSSKKKTTYEKGPAVQLTVVGAVDVAHEAALLREKTAAAERERARAARAERESKKSELEKRLDACWSGRGGILGRLFNCGTGYLGAAVSVADAASGGKVVEAIKEEEARGSSRSSSSGSSSSGSSASKSKSTPKSSSSSSTSKPASSSGGASSAPKSSSENWVTGTVRWPSGEVSRGCPVSASPSGDGTVYTDNAGRFKIKLLEEYLQVVYINGMIAWKGNLRCYKGCDVNLERR